MAVVIKKKSKSDSLRVMAIDPSTKSGVVILDFEAIKAIVANHGIIQFKKLRGIERVVAIGNEVTKLLDLYNPDFCVIEGYGFANKHTFATLVEVGTVIRLAIHEANKVLLEVPPTSVKKFCTGLGNVKKDKMMLEVYKRWGFEGTDDECDAYALAEFGLAVAGKGRAMPTKNMEAIIAWQKGHEDLVSAIRN